MSEPTKKQDAARAEALSWLASRFRWELLLADLQDLADREADRATDDPSRAA